MGSDQSTQKNRADSPCDEGCTIRINNFRPLHFHSVHGDNVKLRKNCSVACRSDGFCKGLAFSDRPVGVCEPIYIKFLEITQNWSGALRIGFTMHDPISMKSKLPRYACPDLTSMPGNWAKAIAERMAKKDSILYYYVDQNGDVHYGIDSEEHGVFFGGINTSTKLWAVIDIYGNTVSVEFIDPNSLNQGNMNDLHGNMVPITRIEENTNSLAPMGEMMYSPLLFHTFHGNNVTLKTIGTIAARKPDFENFAYVFTERSLKIGENIIFEVLQTSISACSKTLVYGITSCDPSNLQATDLPYVEDDLLDRPEYWIVENDGNVYEVGDLIVFSITNEGKLVITKNDNETQNEFHVELSQPLWLFFNMIGSISEIRLVGSSSPDILSDIIYQISRYSKNRKPSHQSNRNNEDAESGTSGEQTFTECVICYEESVNCALYRCGHMCMCYSCAERMWKPSSTLQCPICREVVQDIIKIYR